jgi:hypothetical protein
MIRLPHINQNQTNIRMKWGRDNIPSPFVIVIHVEIEDL